MDSVVTNTPQHVTSRWRAGGVVWAAAGAFVVSAQSPSRKCHGA